MQSNQVNPKMYGYIFYSLPCCRPHLLKQMETRASQRGIAMEKKKEDGTKKNGTYYM